MTTTTETLPAIECAPWCEDGTGHTNAWHPRDQYCMSPDRNVSMLRQPMITDDAGRGPMLDYMRAYLVRDRFEGGPHILLAHNDDAVGDLTLDEARQLGQALIDLADQGTA